MADPTEPDASELAHAIHRRDVSCRDVMLAYLARIDRLNPRVNAIVSLQDQARLVAQADAHDAELARGVHAGWMHGFPIAVKDLVATAGIRTTLGSPLLRNFVPVEDSIMVARMKAAGAIVIGKTNAPESVSVRRHTTRSSVPPAMPTMRPRPAAAAAGVPPWRLRSGWFRLPMAAT